MLYLKSVSPSLLGEAGAKEPQEGFKIPWYRHLSSKILGLIFLY